MHHFVRLCKTSRFIKTSSLRSRHDWGSWDNRIDFTILLQQSINYGKPIPKISMEMVGQASVIGRRNTNEDRIKVKEILPNLLYIALFDGHGGPLAADFCYERLEYYIEYWLRRGENDLENVLTKSFVAINNSFAHFITFNWPGNELMYSGTTATVCLLKNSVELVVAHVGDSRALLCRNAEARKLTFDHNPSSKSEKDRVLKSGGFIKAMGNGSGLVNGRLAMTRSIGDLDLKPFGVIAHPYTRTEEVKHRKDSFLLLASDGVTFALTDQEIIDCANRCGKTSEAASFIADQALHYGCEDNASVVIVPFGAWGKPAPSRNVNSFIFGRELGRSNRF
ncbi:protein phosphatase Mn(2+)-dependent 1K-like [Brevipalpus obovatus]|uniref:protein phosphatase Mn(2+)-dependent 1K-like n=1 Tax=Brevipalpus obovatus TaxID=246614 RepID=UPI003D9EB8D8